MGEKFDSRAAKKVNHMSGFDVKAVLRIMFSA